MPSRANAKFEASVGQEIERRNLFSEQRRVAKVVVKHKTADAQRLRGVRCRHESRERQQFVDKVIRQQERGIAQFLDTAHQRYPLLTRWSVLRNHAKAERSRFQHTVYPSFFYGR